MIAIVVALIAGANPPGMPNPKQARLAMQRYVGCLVNTKAYKIRPLLEEPVSPKLDIKWAKLADEDCLDKYLDTTAPSNIGGGASLSFKPPVARGAVYEALFHKDFADAPRDASFADTPPIHYPTAPDTSAPRSATYAIEMDIGDCVVRHDAVGARAVIDAPIETDDENKAIQSIIPTLSACTPKGQTLTFSKSIIRGLIAEPLYRLTAAQKGLVHAQG